jgi:shikimate kinase/3-dehydroquinate synthase
MVDKPPGRVWIVLAGTMAVGKTTVGRSLARRLGLRFVDLDQRIEEALGPIPALFARGEGHFRACEARALREVLGESPGVLALGGGAYASPENRAQLASAKATVVALVAPWPVLEGRMGRSGARPLHHRAQELYGARLSLWEEADHRVDAAGRVDEVLAAVLAIVDPPTEVRVALGERSYVATQHATYGPLAARLADLGATSWRLLVDPGAEPHAAPVRDALEDLDQPWAELRAGGAEEAKSWDNLGRLLESALASRVDRGTVLIGLGGGALGDLTGLAAALLLRGVRWVHLPTTLLAMVDASVGGKTAVNLFRSKNMVGAFHQPSLVFAATSTLSTLPLGEWRSGLGELVKTALVGDPTLFEQLEVQAEEVARPGDAAVAALGPMVARALQVKALLVSADERERGPRIALNVGHTVGHALEAAAGLGRLRHGELVAVGIVSELSWAQREGLLEEPGLLDRVRRLLGRLGLADGVPAIDREAALMGMRLDKKALGDTLRLPVPVAVGKWQLVDVPVQRLVELMA